MSGLVQLSARNTLVIPLRPGDLALSPTFVVDDITLVRKSELHITVLSTEAGEILTAAFSKVPQLRDAMASLVAAGDWSWALSEPVRFWHLHRDQPDELQTIIAMVDAPGVVDFFAACAKQLPQLAPGVTLPAWDVPPLHVTLYTSDFTGVEGIGLAHAQTLALAQGRADAHDFSGLRAYLLGPDQLGPI